MDAGKNNTHLRNISFSSYLSAAEEIFMHKLAEPVQKPQSAIISSQENLSAISLEKTRTQEAEISVFGAEKYFNLKLDDDSPRQNDTFVRKHGHKKENRVDQLRMEPRSRHRTPSISSESSWNSQTALLRSSARNQSQSKQKKVNGRSFIAGLSCNGSCSDEKSVYINQNVKHRSFHGKEYRKEPVRFDHSPIILDGRKQFKPSLQVKNESNCPSFEKVSIGSKREEYFALQIGKSDDENLKRQLEKEKIRKEQCKEMFGSKAMNKGDIAMNLERKLSMLTWDAIPNAPNLPTISASSQTCEDIESDASSDLFEIEDISGTGQSVYTTTPYEPSEASIEWSVVTGSAADHFPAANLAYDKKNPAENFKNPGAKTNFIVEKEMQRSLPSGLLGCKSHKAVEVAETAYRSNKMTKTVHQQQPQKSVNSMPLRKLKTETKVKGFDFP